MKRARIAVIAAAATVSAGAAVAATQDVLPGQWEAVSTDLGAHGGDRTTTARSCIAPGANLAETLRRQSGEGCRSTRSIVGGGRIDVAAVCPTGTMTIKGSYTPTTMTLAMRGTARIGKTVLPMNIDVKSRRIAAACTDSDD